ncbi:hypothetical protein AEQ67_28310 [Pseudomonas sp. RIT-PI-q]|uniref:MbcA/ParS/Xre antitoxin family protein n=1 Tax=Pseudomonas sp. RIT-PI-q TaxID=1690247 RepID=UPI0006CC6E21|nr:MbcA/ParS/Xre antitoxin family protein [Pseudomonas sp. RIT-PI-q]KPG91891.1 hypothetical protein AEQ67_28310 [Pseudomonas sp. RIT-PI-q]
MNNVELIQHQAECVFGNKAKADHWLNLPKSAYSGISPLQAAYNEAGYEIVKAELERIRHGFSC